MHPAPYWCCPLPDWCSPCSHESAWTPCWWAPWWRLQRALAMRWWCCWCKRSSNSWWSSSPPWLLTVWCAGDLISGLMVGLIIPWWSRAAGRSNKSFLVINWLIMFFPRGFLIFPQRNLLVYHLVFKSLPIGICWFTIGFLIFSHRNLMV